MNKIFGISLAAVLAAVPLVANAANGDVIPGDPGATETNAVAASSAAGYKLAVEDGSEGMMVTAGYVKGAYNAAIKAVNKLAVDKQDVITNLSAIEAGAAAGSAAADAIGSTASLNGKTLVEAINAVKVTADAALTSADLTTTLGDYVTETDLSTTLEDYAKTSDLSGYVTASDLTEGGYVTATGLATTLQQADYATKANVTTAINSATASGTVTVLTTWGNSAAQSTVPVNLNVYAAN